MNRIQFHLAQNMYFNVVMNHIKYLVQVYDFIFNIIRRHIPWLEYLFPGAKRRKLGYAGVAATADNIIIPKFIFLWIWICLYFKLSLQSIFYILNWRLFTFVIFKSQNISVVSKFMFETSFKDTEIQLLSSSSLIFFQKIWFLSISYFTYHKRHKLYKKPRTY